MVQRCIRRDAWTQPETVLTLAAIVVSAGLITALLFAPDGNPLALGIKAGCLLAVVAGQLALAVVFLRRQSPPPSDLPPDQEMGKNRLPRSWAG